MKKLLSIVFLSLFYWCNTYSDSNVELKKVSLTETDIKLVKTGQSLPINLEFPAGIDDELMRVYDSDNKFVALIKYNQLLEQWLPKKVFDIT